MSGAGEPINNLGVASEETSESLASAAAGKAKLDAMIAEMAAKKSGGGVASKPSGIKSGTPASGSSFRGSSPWRPSISSSSSPAPDVKSAATPSTGEQPTPNQKRLAELNDPKNQNGIFSKDPAKQKAAVVELRKALAAEATDEEKERIANAPIAELRDKFKIDPTRVLTVLRERWDEHAEGTVLATFAQQGIAPEAVSEVIDVYVQAFNGAVGNAVNVDAVKLEADARAVFKKHNVPAEVVDTIVEYEKTRLGITKG